MTVQQQILLQRITIITSLMGGKPTIRGLRFLVGDLLESLANGLSQQEILQPHPIMEAAHTQAALLYASPKI